MKNKREILITLAIGSVMMLASFAATAGANNQDEGLGMSGEIQDIAFKHGAPDGTGAGKGEPGYPSAYRNAWNHRNTLRNSYGNMGETLASGPGRGFVDEDGDGVNDLAPDHDGDGIPNGQDPDWIKNKRDGTGYKHGMQGPDSGNRCERSQSRGNGRAQTAR